MNPKPLYVVEERILKGGSKDVYSGPDLAEARKTISATGIYRLLTYKPGKDPDTYTMIGQGYVDGKPANHMNSMITLRSGDIQRLEQLLTSED